MDFPFLSHWPSCGATSSDRRVPHGGVTARRLPALCRAGPRAFARHRRATGPRPHAAQTPPDALTLRSARDGPAPRKPRRRQVQAAGAQSPWERLGTPAGHLSLQQVLDVAGTTVVWRGPQSRRGAARPQESLGQLEEEPSRRHPRHACSQGPRPRPGATGREGGGAERRPIPPARPRVLIRPSTGNPAVLETFLVSDTGVLCLGTRFFYPIKHPIGACGAGGAQAGGGGWGASHPSPQSLTPAPEPGPVRTSSFSLLAAK